ncbi:hypothetical protein P692DRAFT_20956464 [Suillus brevipes Sb2]|nr:hypothetical protein P692DRAFT_20956464 [Suillus brevipes Sb2]
MAAQGTNGRGREVSTTRARGRGSRGSAHTSSQSPQPSNMKAASAAKIPAIYWEKRYSARTSRLIEWCKANDEARIKLFSDSAKDAKDEGRLRQQMSTKLFSDSAKDAKDEGRLRQQMSTQKEKLHPAAGCCDFTNDEDPAIRVLYMMNIHLSSSNLSKVGSSRMLRKKYNSVNKDLGKTGAGLQSIEELDADPRTKNLLSSVCNFRGWRTNPSYNTAFSTADPGQDFASEALEFFSLGLHKTKHHTPPYIPSPPPTPVTDLSLLDSPRFTTSPLLPSNFHLDHYGRSTSCAAVQQTNTNRPPDISLDSPPRCAKEDGFFTDMDGQPESSCDKGIEESGSTTNADVVPESLKAEVYVNPRVLAKHQELHPVLAQITQTFIADYAAPLAHAFGYMGADSGTN